MTAKHDADVDLTGRLQAAAQAGSDALLQLTSPHKTANAGGGGGAPFLPAFGSLED